MKNEGFPLPPALYTPWVIIAYSGGKTTYYGPFTNMARAKEYARTVPKAVCEIHQMIAPHRA